MSLPTKKQIDDLAIETKFRIETNDRQIMKHNCEYIWSIMVETLNKAVTTQDSSSLIHTDIDKNKLKGSLILPFSYKNCLIGPENEPIKKLLEPAGITLDITPYNMSTITYFKISKRFVI